MGDFVLQYKYNKFLIFKYFTFRNYLDILNLKLKIVYEF